MPGRAIFKRLRGGRRRVHPARGGCRMGETKKKGQGEMSEHKHTNRLQNETSPYLLQHAHNPVDWYPWGEEALANAREKDKPIFLSISYAVFCLKKKNV